MSKKLILRGLGVSSGMAKGRVCLIGARKDYAKLREGDILVTKITDPGMTIIINQAAGIICDIGGMTSHPAIISRELGIPAVVAAKTATTTLYDGMLLEIDGSSGEIFLIE